MLTEDGKSTGKSTEKEQRDLDTGRPVPIAAPYAGQANQCPHVTTAVNTEVTSEKFFGNCYCRSHGDVAEKGTMVLPESVHKHKLGTEKTKMRQGRAKAQAQRRAGAEYRSGPKSSFS